MAVQIRAGIQLTGRTNGGVVVRAVTWLLIGMLTGREVDQSHAATWQRGIGQYV